MQVHTSAFKNRTKRCMKKQRRWRNGIPNGRWMSDKELSLVTKLFQSPVFTVAQDYPVVHSAVTAPYQPALPGTLPDSR